MVINMFRYLHKNLDFQIFVQFLFRSQYLRFLYFTLNLQYFQQLLAIKKVKKKNVNELILWQ